MDVLWEQKKRQLFVRMVKSRTGGYVYDADRLRAFSISHLMYKNANADILSYGVFAIQ